METFDRSKQEQTTPQQALNRLKDGNERFVNNISTNRVYLQQMQLTKDTQHPFGIILSCIDSRGSSEIIFDLGLGDVFTIRVAGNVVNDDILGSMEFSCKVAGAKLLVVLGHTNCGAVKGACDHVEMGNLTGLLKKIYPQVEAASAYYEDKTSANDGLVFDVTKRNVFASKEEILSKSSIIRELVETGEVLMVGAMLDITSGKVTFYEEW